MSGQAHGLKRMGTPAGKPVAVMQLVLLLIAMGALFMPVMAVAENAPDGEVLTLCDALREPPSPGRERAEQALEDRVLQGADETVGAALLARIYAWYDEQSRLTEAVLPGSPSLLAFLDSLAQAATSLEAETPLTGTIRVLIDYTGLCGTPEQVASLAPLLDNAQLSTVTLRAMMRTPGAAVTRALINALGATLGDSRRHIVAALGMRGDKVATEALRAMAPKESDPATAWAIVEALSRMGVPPAEAVRLPPNVAGHDAARFANANLRAALMQAAQGDKAQAASMLYRFLDLYALRHQLCAALLGLSRLNAPELTRAALGFINTPGVRETVIQVLTQSEDPKLEDTLTRAWPVTDPSMQAAILQILSARASSKVAPLVNEAAGSSNVELRVTAARLCGQTPNPGDLLTLAASGPPWTREPALEDYLALADWNGQTGSEEAAVRMFLTVLDGSESPEAHLRALRGIETYGGPALIDYVKGLQYDPALEEAAARTLVALTVRLPDGEARKEALETFARDTKHPDAAALAALALQSEGGEVEQIARERGYLLEWEVLGPLPRQNPDGFEDPLFDVGAGRPPRTIQVDGEDYTWSLHVASGIPAVVMLDPEPGVRAYAVAEAPVRDWLPVEIYVACADGGRLWINGEPVWQALGTGLDPNDAEPVNYTLEPGRNRLVLELLNDRGPWGFWVRLAGRRGGKPVDPALLEMPEDGTTGVGVRPGDLAPLLDPNAP